jgi:hypothetical protein
MALSANQKEEAYIQAFIKTLKDLAKNGDQLNGVQLKGVEGMTKWMTQMSNTNTETKANLKIEKDKFTLGKKELEVRERLKKSDEHLVELRHKLNIEQEREHGDQVRRNINLRHNMDSFNDKFEMLKKSLTGGFGFQAAMDKTVKDLGGMTRTFQENKIAQEKYKEAVKTSAEALQKMQIAFLTQDPVEMEEAKQELGVAKKGEARTKIDVENTQDELEKKGIAGKLKPMFAKLDKVGEFLGKKALPIGLGVGVAGVLMSVIVKAFSASPLFAQMMKLMKFMVTLILMPIGTFFGALLRPILIMLLRKFIVPMYSQFMPIALKVGGQIGKWLAGGAPVEPFDSSTENIKSGDANIWEFLKWASEKQEKGEEGIADVFNPAMADTGDSDSTTTGDSDSDVSIQSNADFIDQVAEHYGLGDPTFIGETPSDSNIQPNNHIWGGGEGLPEYVNPIDAPTNPSNLSDWHEQLLKDAKNQHTLGDQEDIFDAARQTGGIIEDTMPKFGEREQLWNEQTGRGGDIKNAGANIEAANAKNASAGYTMGGTAKSQSILEAYNAFKNGVTAANGFDGMVNSPTMFLAGEAGSEHVSITPNGQGGGSSIVVNIGTMNGSDNDLRKLKQTILEVIQESSANRGRL